MSDLLKCSETKSGNVITCAGRGAYVSFFTPRGIKGDEKSDPKYQGSLLIPAKANVKLLIEKVDKVIAEKWGADAKKKMKIKLPFLKTEEHVHSFVKDEDEDVRAKFCKEFPFFIRCSSKQKPDVLFASGERCEDAGEAYSGRYMRFSVRPYAWEHKLNGKGVSFGLQNVQLLEHAERFAGGRAKAEDEFEAVDVGGSEGGTAGDMGWE